MGWGYRIVYQLEQCHAVTHAPLESGSGYALEVYRGGFVDQCEKQLDDPAAIALKVNPRVVFDPKATMMGEGFQ